MIVPDSDPRLDCFEIAIMRRFPPGSKWPRGSPITTGDEALADRVDEYQTVANVGDVAEGTGLPVEVNGRAIALFLVDGDYFAIDDQCPHQGAPLCDGVVFDRTVTCTWHGWRFSLEDGRWLDSPRIRIGTYPVRVEGDQIQVAVVDK